MKANVYVDGFNLYYGAVKGTPYRWLDIAAMCRLLLPHDQIDQIKYFTALINPRPQDPDQPTRQQTYLRALRTIPNLTIILGHFLTHDVMMPLAPPANGYVKVTKTEEKGSDVNLATHLLVDGYTATMRLQSSSPTIQTCLHRFRWRPRNSKSRWACSIHRSIPAVRCCHTSRSSNRYGEGYWRKANSRRL